MLSKYFKEKIIKYLIVFLSIPLSVLLEGFTLVYLWQWFIVSKFKLPTLSIIEAYGLILVSYYITSQFKKQNKEDERDKFDLPIKELCISLFKEDCLKPAVYLIVGFIIHLCL